MRTQRARRLARSAGRPILATLLAALLLTPACGDEGVVDEESARLAYEGLDPSIDKALDLGFQGFNEASSANIPEQSTTGDASGTLTIGGKVDQGASNNKEMTLDATYTDYSDGDPDEEDDIVDVIYDSQGTVTIDLSLKGLPNADLTGTIVGTVIMDGGLLGPVTLDLAITGETEDDGTGKIRRKAGTVRVTGTATSDYGTFQVDVTH